MKKFSTFKYNDPTAVSIGFNVGIINVYSKNIFEKTVLIPKLSFWQKLKLLFTRHVLIITGVEAAENINRLNKCKKCLYKDRIECPMKDCIKSIDAPFFAERRKR